ncbi:MAG: hypothetical protein ACFFBK_13320 [Promethearchaeota archaeon]
MYNNMEDPTSEYEKTLNKLSDQITELFSQIHYYQALVAEKDNQILQLTNENKQLLAKINALTQQVSPPPQRSQQTTTIHPPPSQQSYTPPPRPTPLTPAPSSSVGDSRIMKRQCPNCGAMGFAIREVDDKNKIISYIPRRIYAKKRICTKCRYEW